MSASDPINTGHQEPSEPTAKWQRDAGVAGPIVARLNELLRDRTFAEIARATEFNSETVRRYMRGGQPSVAFVVAVARHYRVSLDWLLLGDAPGDGSGYGDGQGDAPVGPRHPSLRGAAGGRLDEDDDGDGAPRGPGSYGVIVRGVAPGGALREGA